MTQELRNIPYYWTAIAHWSTCAAIIVFYKKRFAAWKTVLISAGFLLILTGWMYLTAPLHRLPFNLMMAAFAGLTGLHFWVLSPLRIRPVLYYGARLFILSGFMSSLIWQIYIFYSQRYEMLCGTVWEILFLTAGYAVFLTVMLLIELPKRDVTSDITITWHTAVSNVIIAVVIYILSSLSFTTLQTPFGGKTYAEAFNIRTLVYFGGVALMYAVQVFLYETHAEAERDALRGMLDLQYRSYQLGQESVDLVNQKYHDLKHQIALLRSEFSAGHRLENLDRLEEEIRIYETMYQTGNQVLDTILMSKGIHCLQEGITLSCVADGAQLSFMEDIDISALFGNAVDNAIEAVVQIPDPAQRLIDLNVSRHNGFLRILVRNRYKGRIKMNKGLPLTSKDDARYHGYGIKSIVSTAEKYGGSATFDAKDGRFELRILIPIQ